MLCDPWRSPAYFASWFVFPDNSDVDFAAFKPDFLYISHLHRDHFDPELLATERAEVHDRPAAGLPDRRAAIGLERPRVPLVRPDPKRRAGRARRPPGDDHRHGLPERRPDRRLGPVARRRRGADPRPERRPPSRALAAHRLRRLRRALPPVLRRHLVARRLRAARGEQDRVRQAQAAERDGAGAALHRCGRGALRLPDGWAAVFPGRATCSSTTTSTTARTTSSRTRRVFLDYLGRHGLDNGRLLIPGSVAVLDAGAAAR